MTTLGEEEMNIDNQRKIIKSARRKLNGNKEKTFNIHLSDEVKDAIGVDKQFSRKRLLDKLKIQSAEC